MQCNDHSSKHCIKQRQNISGWNKQCMYLKWCGLISDTGSYFLSKHIIFQQQTSLCPLHTLKAEVRHCSSYQVAVASHQWALTALWKNGPDKMSCQFIHLCAAQEPLWVTCPEFSVSVPDCTSLQYYYCPNHPKQNFVNVVYFFILTFRSKNHKW